MREPLVVGNWKMNGTHESVQSLVSSLVKSDSTCQTVICPPYVFLSQVQSLIENSEIELGAQNLDWHKAGAYTGEVSATMLLDSGCRYSIVGHSERRGIYGETNEQAAAKFGACLSAGIKPILCLGETHEQRLAGKTDRVVEEQLAVVVEKNGVSGFTDAIVAYEPVWAIGTGETASPAQAESVHQMIRDSLSNSDVNISKDIQILYGGSVSDENAAELFEMENIDGALVGGASLKAGSFNIIRQLASQAAG
ncbi:MAG TPA: triose-phosphate isomerase [Pseudomonadales bacterium]|jgi:triosephosphate isomerase|nr:triose-phosphate isomerase [Gammaproteobacteria bacterium]MDP6024510.1 triose-phosphate isomerase [Pseudomonadales bacterium]MDP6317356.1 triose-phosphate isomerase [Pseudomonadales bacterium]MDP7313312.1 triose-phosphate isomerase [Pseudomonadales bacterium]MDP7576256.1 triose-phosphate isomerase [Pseudomonadales bacterium]|tara:strand:- start:243 stop:998 length:756 start_codon:yes stop_codon:yes gene_type:complete